MSCEYQPFFVAFAHSQGVTPEQANQPGLGVDFVPWIGRAWREYFASIGRPVTGEMRTSEADFPRFTAWLAERYPAPTLPRNALLTDSDSAGSPSMSPHPEGRR